MTIIVKKLRSLWNHGTTKLTIAAICAHSASISIGISQGYSAILIPQLVASPDFRIDSEQSSWLASLGAVTNPVGSILSGVLAEWLGRTRSIQISSIPFIIGWGCISCAKDIRLLYVGRLITGIAGGMSTACYTYITEVSTQEHRGLYQSFGPVSASFGILFTYTLGYFASWDIVALVSSAFGFFTLITMQFMPESPAFLLKKGRKEESLASLVWLRGNKTAAQSEYEAISTAHTNSKTKFKEYLKSSTVKPFYILIVLFLLQDLSGIYSILFYAVNFFQDFNISLDEYLSSIVVGVIRFFMSIVGAFMISRYGRKTLCMVSSTGMGASLLLTGLYVKYYETHSEEARIFPILPVLGVLANVLFSMIGMLPIPWILVGELFPLEVRSIMGGIVICIAQCFIFICVKVYPDMISSFNFSGTLFSFAVASFLALVFSKFCLVETKDKSLEEIKEHFESKKDPDGADGKKGLKLSLFESCLGQKKICDINSVYTVNV